MSAIGQVSPSLLTPLLEADRTRDFKEIFEAMRSILLTDRVGLQAIEKVFRENNCYTHLIARERGNIYSKEVKFAVPPDPEPKLYYLWISTRDKGEAMKELLQESKTYDDNFNKLSKTGFVLLDEDTPMNQQVNGGIVETVHATNPHIRARFNVQYLNVTVDAFTGLSQFLMAQFLRLINYFIRPGGSREG
jgi:hypothetical protein